MNDELKIFELYLEMAKQPVMRLYSNGEKQWWLDGMLHREDGPAVEWHDGNQWYLYGTWYKTPDKWAQTVLRLRNKPHSDADVDAFLKQILKKDVDEAL